MAKAKAKAKSPKSSVDPLAVSLKQLTLADKEVAQAIRHLDRAILNPVSVPQIVPCEFKLNKKRYRARVTAEQCAQILEAVAGDGDVLKVVSLLLGALTKQIAEDLDGFATTLDIQAKVKVKPAGKVTVVLGCCIYNGGATPNLTQAQCQQYNPTKWDNTDPGCKNSTMRQRP